MKLNVTGCLGCLLNFRVERDILVIIVIVKIIYLFIIFPYSKVRIKFYNKHLKCVY